MFFFYTEMTHVCAMIVFFQQCKIKSLIYHQQLQFVFLLFLVMFTLYYLYFQAKGSQYHPWGPHTISISDFFSSSIPDSTPYLITKPLMCQVKHVPVLKTQKSQHPTPRTDFGNPCSRFFFFYVFIFILYSFPALLNN